MTGTYCVVVSEIVYHTRDRVPYQRSCTIPDIVYYTRYRVPYQISCTIPDIVYHTRDRVPYQRSLNRPSYLRINVLFHSPCARRSKSQGFSCSRRDNVTRQKVDITKLRSQCFNVSLLEYWLYNNVMWRVCKHGSRELCWKKTLRRDISVKQGKDRIEWLPCLEEFVVV